MLTYVTGGLAYGKADLDGTNTVGGVVNGVLPFSVTSAVSHNAVNTGWVVGFGTEAYKIESLYMDLGTLDTRGVTSGVSFGICLAVCNGGPFAGTGGQVTTHTHFYDGILRLGLNYQFH